MSAAPKRFWKAVAVAPAGAGFAVELDGRPLRTPGKAPLVLPGRALAEAVAAEWAAAGERIDPAAMPLTRAANTAIDRVTPQAAAVRAELAGYGGTDLLCYRAPHPEGLAARQAAGWDPWLRWAAEALGARLVAVAGVMPEPQPEAALAALGAALERLGPWELTAQSELVALSGSLVLGLAVGARRLEAAAAWDLSRIDEDWQIAAWGEDEEAAATAARRRADFLQAARLLALLGAA